MRILKSLSDSDLLFAFESNQISNMSHLPGGKSYEDHKVKWIISGIPSPWLNYVVYSNFAKVDIDNKIKNILTYFKLRRIPITWWIFPSAVPTNLGVFLKKHGMKYTGYMTGMAIDLTAVKKNYSVPSGFTIEQVCNKEMLEKFVGAFAKGFGVDYNVSKAIFSVDLMLDIALPLRHYIGTLDGIPVATSSLLLEAGVAGIYHIATIPEARKRGIGTAMTTLPLHEARDLGYHIAILLSSKIGEKLYRKLGFNEICKVYHYILEREMYFRTDLQKYTFYISKLWKNMRRFFS